MLVATVAASVLYVCLRDRVCDVTGNSMSPALADGQRVWLIHAEEYGRYDVVSLRNPYARRGGDSLSLKRIVGLPGDTIQLINKDLYVNGKLQNSDFCRFDRCDVLPDDSGIRAEERSRCLFPFSSYYRWSKDFYGPLIVPRQGMSIKLTVGNYVAYKHLIEKYEGSAVQWKDGECVVDGKSAVEYVFKRDYYFVLNDYRDDPSDSRTFGPVPDGIIVGKVKTLKK